MIRLHKDAPWNEVTLKNGKIEIQVFQVANAISKGVTTILYSEFTLSPYNFNIDEYPEIKEKNLFR